MDKKEQKEYQTDLSGIHASADLIARTKQKAAMEETAVKKQKRFYKKPVLAAAALLLLCILAYPLWRLQTVPGQESNTDIYLGSQDGSVGEPYAEASLEVKKMTILPLSFKNHEAEEIQVQGCKLIITVEDGYYLGAYKKEQSYYVIYSNIASREAFIDAVDQMLTEK